jgi:hypothetical protein
MKLKLKLEGLPLYILIALGGLAILVAIIVFFNRGSHIRVEGSVQKVRTVSTGDNSSVGVIDFHFVNPANYPFVIRSVDIVCETRGGELLTSRFASQRAVDDLFKYKALELGAKYNNTLKMGTRIEPGQSLDAMVAGAFDVPEQQLKERKRFLVRVEELDGAVTEIAEKR